MSAKPVPKGANSERFAERIGEHRITVENDSRILSLDGQGNGWALNAERAALLARAVLEAQRSIALSGTWDPFEDLSVNPDGSLSTDCAPVGGGDAYGRGDSTPQKAAALARHILEAQGWLFSKDGGCAAELKRYPTVADPEGLGDGMAQALARAVLEKGGWQFVEEPSGVVAGINLGPGLSRDRIERLENYALGVLASSLQSPNAAAVARLRGEIYSLLAFDPSEPSTEKALEKEEK